MNKHAIYHRPESNFCFAIDENTVVLRIRFAKGERIDKLSVLYNTKYEIAEKQIRQHMEFLCCDGSFDYYATTLRLKDPRLAYIFEFFVGNNIYYYCETGVVDSYNFSFAYYDSFQVAYINKNDVIQNVKWMNNAVFYQIFVDRFDKASTKNEEYINSKWNDLPTPKSFFGGDLDGVIKHLDYIQSLGVTAIYLNPIFKSPSNHKYDTVDYFNVDETFGGNDAFKRLVQSCHRRGIKVILDAVFNHVSERFYPFEDVKKLGSQSKYFKWFIIKGDEISSKLDNYDCFASCTYMPKLNTNNVEVQEYLLKIVEYWIQEYEIDGWRLDVADEVSHDFWRIMRKRVKSIKPNAVLIGENWHNSETFLGGDQFDSIMNYGITKAFLDYWAKDVLDETAFANALNAQLVRYTDITNGMMFNLLDCHDTHRFFTEVGCDVNKLIGALITMVFLPGSINVYYGTEILTEGGYDPDSRRTFDFKRLNNPEILKLKDKITWILKLKKQPAIKNGGVKIYSQDGCVIVERKGNSQTLKLKISKNENQITTSQELTCNADGETKGNSYVIQGELI